MLSILDNNGSHPIVTNMATMEPVEIPQENTFDEFDLGDGIPDLELEDPDYEPIF